eukprot:1139963-Pelagomonas_calceolata.AAC.4
MQSAKLEAQIAMNELVIVPTNRPLGTQARRTAYVYSTKRRKESVVRCSGRAAEKFQKRIGDFLSCWTVSCWKHRMSARNPGTGSVISDHKSAPFFTSPPFGLI